MKRLAGAVALMTLLVLLPTGAALAKGPSREPVPDSGGTLTAGLVCPFQVTVATVVNRETQTTFFDANGDPAYARVTGALFLRVTNDDTGASQVLNVSGPYTLTFHEDRSITISGTGPQLFGLFPSDEGGPALLYVRGSISLVRAPDGTFHDVSERG